MSIFLINKNIYLLIIMYCDNIIDNPSSKDQKVD